MIKPLSQVIGEPALPDVSKLEKLLSMLGKTIEEPKPYGSFHLSFLFGIFALCLACLFFGKFLKRKHVNLILFITASTLIFLEVVKQLYSSYYPADDTWVYPWSIFPFQFCSTPMYIMMLAALCRKGKVYEACNAFLATYGLFAGVLVVVIAPSSVLVDDLFLSVHTLIYHGLMIVVPVLLYGTGTVKPQFNVLQKAMPIFVILVAMAVIMNSVYAKYGNPDYNFNMFYISPTGTTPMEWIDNLIANMSAATIAIGYAVIFTTAALLVLLFAMLVKLCLGKRLYKKTDEQADGHPLQETKQELLTQNK